MKVRKEHSRWSSGGLGTSLTYLNNEKRAPGLTWPMAKRLKLFGITYI